jgi:hypothetical protein
MKRERNPSDGAILPITNDSICEAAALPGIIFDVAPNLLGGFQVAIA